MRKINVDTDNRLAMTGQIRKILHDNREEFDPRKYLKPAKDAMAAVCKARFEQFGAAGQASSIKPLSLATMATRYAKGEFG